MNATNLRNLQNWRRSWIVPGLMLSSILCGCDSWKRTDASAGLLLVPGVSTVTVDGRELIRIRMKRSAVWIDQHGGRIVKFRLQRRPGISWTDDEEGRPTPQESPTSQPLSAEGLADTQSWIAVSEPGNPALDRSMCWVVDGNDGQVNLLGEEVDGLRWRRSYQLLDSGRLQIRVSLENRGWATRQLTVASIVEGSGEDVLTGSQLVRTFQIDSDTTTQPFAQGDSNSATLVKGISPVEMKLTRQVGPGQRLAWTEEWTIIKRQH